VRLRKEIQEVLWTSSAATSGPHRMVTIDPVIQDIGIRYHPDRPYQDSRVVRHLGCGIGDRGLAESFSTLLGFRHLLILAICFYILSAWMPSTRGKPG